MKLDPAEPHLTKPNLTKPNLTKPNLTKPNLTKPYLTKPNQTFGDITDDTQLNVIEKVKISVIKQPVRALSAECSGLNKTKDSHGKKSSSWPRSNCKLLLCYGTTGTPK